MRMKKNHWTILRIQILRGRNNRIRLPNTVNMNASEKFDAQIIFFTNQEVGEEL